MLEKPIARRYARAVIGVAQQANVLEDVAADLAALAHLMDTHQELQHALLSPSFKAEQRRALLNALMDAGPAGRPIQQITRQLVMLLVDKGRLPYLSLISQMFRHEVDRLAGRVRAEVWSAQPLSKEELESVSKALEAQAQKRNLGTQVVVNANVDQDLIAGIKARLGGLVFDGTLKNHLRKMGQQLTG